MSATGSRRFPSVSGPFGWAGLAVVLAALVCEAVAVFGILAAALENQLGQAGPWFIVFLVSLPLFAAGGWLLRLGSKRAGTLPASSVAEKRPALLRAGGVILVGSVLGFGGFLYLAFAVQGSRRLTLAFAALVAGGVISEFGVQQMLKVLGRPGRRFLGLSPKRSLILSIAFLLIDAGFLLIGLLWPDLIPMP